MRTTRKARGVNPHPARPARGFWVSTCWRRGRFASARRYVGVLKKFSSVVEGSVIEGQMDPAVVGKFKMTPLESSMAADLKKAAEINDDVRISADSARQALVSVWCVSLAWASLVFAPFFSTCSGQIVCPVCCVSNLPSQVWFLCCM